MITRCDQNVRVVARSELSPTCFRLDLECERAIVAQPGQFGMLTCGEGLDPLLRRAFSIAAVTPAGDRSIVSILAKEVGRGTHQLRALPLGATLRLLAPLGRGFTLTAEAHERLALVAGGIGLPPVVFAAEALAARGVGFDLFYGAATAAELIDLDRCRAAAAGRGELVLVTDDGSAGEMGFVTEAVRRRVTSGRRYRRLLACGPDPMLRAVGRLAEETGVESEVSLEEPMACGVGVCLGCVVELADGRMVPSCKEGPVFATTALGEGWRR